MRTRYKVGPYRHAYRSDQHQAAGARGVVVPQPPPLAINPTRTRALVTVCVGDEGRALLAISGPSMQAYADRIGVDHVVLDWPGHPAWPMSAKFAIPRTLDHYDRVAYVDADVVLRPEAVNLFDLCAADEFGAFDELPYSRAYPQYEQEARYVAFRKRLAFKTVPIPHYFNAGVMVIPHRAAAYLLPPDRPLVPGHTEEQDHTNARLLDAALAGRVKYRMLDRRANWQNWNDFGFRTAPADAVLHFSGGGEIRKRRQQDMAACVAKHPWFTPEAPSNHAWEIDARHLHWIQAVLASGRFSRVLEIGCFLGYSTQAFLSVCDQLDVHLCDVESRPELARRMDGRRVTFHAERSVDLLARDASFDLVFIDGDHRSETVGEELRLLLAQGVGAIFAHDTADNPSIGRFDHCDGPNALKRRLMETGYFVWEDAERRPFELTDRGMLWAAREREVFDFGMEAWFTHGANR